jgi:hypothetical protein
MSNLIPTAQNTNQLPVMATSSTPWLWTKTSSAIDAIGKISIKTISIPIYIWVARYLFCVKKHVAGMVTAACCTTETLFGDDLAILDDGLADDGGGVFALYRPSSLAAFAPVAVDCFGRRNRVFAVLP